MRITCNSPNQPQISPQGPSEARETRLQNFRVNLVLIQPKIAPQDPSEAREARPQTFPENVVLLTLLDKKVNNFGKK